MENGDETNMDEHGFLLSSMDYTREASSGNHKCTVYSEQQPVHLGASFQVPPDRFLKVSIVVHPQVIDQFQE